MSCGMYAARLTGAKSLSTSNGSLGYSFGLIVCDDSVKSTV